MVDFLIDYPWVILALFVIGWIAVRYGGRIYRFARLRRAGIADIDRMEGGAFEDYLEMLFNRKGYQVRQLKLHCDPTGRRRGNQPHP